MQHALSFFTGPLVENLFSEIQSLVKDRKNHMSPEMISARQTLRYVIKSEGHEKELFPIGAFAPPARKQEAVNAVLNSCSNYVEKLKNQKEENTLMEKIYGVTKLTKKVKYFLKISAYIRSLCNV